MEVKPSYKQTEVGAIPEDWEVKRLGDLASVTAGGTPSRSVAAYWNGDIPWITTSELGSRTINQAEQFITKEGLNNSAAKLLPPGTLLMALYGQGKTRGKVGVLGIEATTNQASAAISLGPGVSVSFVLHFLDSRYEAIRNLSNVGNQENLNSSLVRSILIVLPPSGEQEAIAGVLNDTDAFIASLEQLLSKKRHLKEGAMQDLLTGKKRLLGFSGGWEVKPLGDLFDFSGGFTASRDQLSLEGYCYLHYGDIHTSKKSFIDVRSEYQEIAKLDVSLRKVPSISLLDDGDVVFVDASEDIEGTSKHVVVINPDGIPFISGLHTIVAKGKISGLQNQYRRYCFQTTAVKAQFRFFAVGTKVSGISKTNIARITLPVPSIPEQIAIADVLSDIAAEIAALEAKLMKARLLKEGITHELLSGRIRLV